MAPAALAAAPALPGRRLAGAALLAALSLLAILLVLVMGVVAALFGLPGPASGFAPSATARAEIPPLYLRLYEHAGRRYGIDPWVLAAIGWIETQHGRSTAPGVRSGVNAFGCCAGPMQFSLVGAPSTWQSFGVDGNRDGRRSPYDPADAIPAAARYLRASGAPPTTAPPCSPTTTPTGTSTRCSPKPPSTAPPPPPRARSADWR